ncbi:galanin receptor 2b-like [Erythrolamprus reginae]|uniref:galanin receptor 2b-like n=1 Tax=Erythrolamprus reginae TaxID=121349 RepID=UPI00396C787D
MSEQEELADLGRRWNSSELNQFSRTKIAIPVVFSIIFLLGIVGNSLVLGVLLNNSQRGCNQTSLFILNLSLANFFFIVFCVPFQATIYSMEGWVFGAFMCKVVHFFIYLTMYASSFTLAAVSVDRYLAIRYPLHSRELRTAYSAVMTMLIIWGLSTISSGPYLSYYNLVQWEDSYICVPGWDGWRRKIMETSTFIFGYIIPALIVSLSYTRTIKHLWTSVDPLMGMVESKKSKWKVTKMIIIVTILFWVCWLPYDVLVLHYLYGDFPFNQTTYVLRLLSHCMAYANSCLNPIVYALVSTHFCKGFKKVFRCLLRRKPWNNVQAVHNTLTEPGLGVASTDGSRGNEDNG